VHLFCTVVLVGIGQNWGDCNRSKHSQRASRSPFSTSVYERFGGKTGSWWIQQRGALRWDGTSLWRLRCRILYAMGSGTWFVVNNQTPAVQYHRARLLILSSWLQRALSVPNPEEARVGCVATIDVSISLRRLPVLSSPLGIAARPRAVAPLPLLGTTVADRGVHPLLHRGEGAHSCGPSGAHPTRSVDPTPTHAVPFSRRLRRACKAIHGCRRV